MQDGKEAKMIEKIYKIYKAIPTKIIIGATFGALTLGMIADKKEHLRETAIPLGFSEIHQIEKEAAEQGRDINPGTEYYAKLNDAYMKIFEAWNNSWELKSSKKNSRNFAKELAKKMDNQNKEHHYSLDELLAELPSIAKETLQEGKKMINLENRMQIVNSNLERAWKETHHDEYRIEVYPALESDSDGKGSHIVMRTRQVYDYSDHKYFYSTDSANKAIEVLEELFNQPEQTPWPGKLIFSKTVNNENSQAIVASRTKLDKNVKLTDQDIAQIAKVWNSGSVYKNNIDTIIQANEQLVGHMVNLKKADETAKPEYNMRTYTTSHPDPKEYTVAKKAQSTASTIVERVERWKRGIEHTLQNATTLKKEIKELIDAQAYGNNYDPKIDYEAKAKHILSVSQMGYSSNITEGFDVAGYRKWMVALFSAMGSVVGAGATFGGIKLGEYLANKKDKSYY